MVRLSIEHRCVTVNRISVLICRIHNAFSILWGRILCVKIAVIFKVAQQLSISSNTENEAFFTQLWVSGWSKVWWRNLRKRLMTAASQSEGISRWCGGWLKFSALWSVMSREGVGTQRGLCCETHSLFLWGSGGPGPSAVFDGIEQRCVRSLAPLLLTMTFLPSLNFTTKALWKLFEDLRLLAYS